MRVLIVESSAAVSVRLVDRLREAGLEVVGMVATAAAALERAHALVPDAIVLDPHLPDQSGLGILSELRALTPRALLVVFGHDPHARYRSHCRAHGADLFFDKASELDELAARLAVGATS